MNRKILKSKESEITRAGRLFFDAVFGDQKEIERELAEEDTERAPGDAAVIDVEACTVLECGVCHRELIVPTSLDSTVIAAQDWRFTEGVWTCRTCTPKKETP